LGQKYRPGINTGYLSVMCINRCRLKLRRADLSADRRRMYLFGSNSITYNDTNDKIKQISRARLPENPEVNHAGHPSLYNNQLINGIYSYLLV